MALHGSPAVVLRVASMLALACLALAGCTTTTAAPARPTVTAETIPNCENPYGGDCRGTLPAGTFHTWLMHPRLHYRVSRGWQNITDLSGNFVLIPPGADATKGGPGGTNDLVMLHSTDYLAVETSVIAARPGCPGDPDLSVPTTPKAIADHLRHRPDLAVTHPEPVTLSGLHGLRFDVTAARPRLTAHCPGEGSDTVTDVLENMLPTDGRDLIIPGMALRLWLLQRGSETLAVSVGDFSGGTHFDRYEPIIEHLRFR